MIMNMLLINFQPIGRKSKKMTLKKKYMIEKKVRAHKKKQKKIQRKQPELLKSKSHLSFSLLIFFLSFSFYYFHLLSVIYSFIYLLWQLNS